jgi:membrane protein implicated in regulation of membrane protease activity
MKKPGPPELDMTLEGEFVTPPTPPISARIMVWAVVIALITGGVALAALALWVALIILPVALGAAVVAYALFRYRMWRAQRSVGGQQSVWRP